MISLPEAPWCRTSRADDKRTFLRAKADRPADRLSGGLAADIRERGPMPRVADSCRAPAAGFCPSWPARIRCIWRSSSRFLPQGQQKHNLATISLPPDIIGITAACFSLSDDMPVLRVRVRARERLRASDCSVFASLNPPTLCDTLPAGRACTESDGLRSRKC